MLSQKLKDELNIEIDKQEPVIRDFIYGEYFRHNLDLIIKVNVLNALEAETLELEVILLLIKISDYADIEMAIERELNNLDEKKKLQLVSDLNEYIFRNSRSNKKLEVQTDGVKQDQDLRSQIVDSMLNKNIDEMTRHEECPVIPNTVSTELPVSSVLKEEPDTHAGIVLDNTDPYLNHIEDVDKVIKKSQIVI
jgi:hypothetical protein